jgi:chromate reductase, NAD(P)H dehydrogenase (quinone)
MRLLALSGSLRRDSHNSALVRIAAGLAPDHVEVEVFEGLGEVEPYDQDLDSVFAPPGAAAFRQALEEADALIIATPEYNSSIPGQLKNALDWASRPLGDSALTGLPVAVVGASTSRFGAVWAQAELRKVLGASGARVVDGELAIAQADEAIVAGTRLRDSEATEALRRVVEAVVAEGAAHLEALAA